MVKSIDGRHVSCGACAYSIALNPVNAICRFNPPTVFLIDKPETGERQAVTQWPIVGIRQACAQFAVGDMQRTLEQENRLDG